MKYLLRFVFVIAGLIFAASLTVMMLVVLILWSFRALWYKLTGRPVMPFAMRMNPRAGFERVFKKSGSYSAAPKRRELSDVTDVEPKR
jgi:flagellar biosynthesis protein FlhB